MQYVPENGLYVYFRYDKSQTVMCIMNPENQSKTLVTGRFKEMLSGKSTARDVVSGNSQSLAEIKVPAKTILVLEIK